jgi:ABC-type amino acid transport substrate-binding protein
MTTCHVKTAAIIAGALVLAACAPRTRVLPVSADPPLRVAVTPNIPPMIFKQNGELVGVEADLARRLAHELGREVQFVEVAWEDLIPALLQKRADVIMSAMTITAERQVRIAFGSPYLDSGLMAMMPTSKRDKYETPEAVIDTSADVGVRRGTTGEAFVRGRFAKADPVTYLDHQDAVFDLKRGRIDLYVDDAPLIVWLASENEADTALLDDPLVREPLGWGMRLEDVDLRAAVDGTLRRWKSDGTLALVLRRWLPYWPGLDDY